jgi:hypothetical protein
MSAEDRRDITIGELSKKLASNDSEESALHGRRPGYRRLNAVSRREFSDELNWRTLDLLRGLLCGLLETGTDRVDNLKLSEAAGILETAERPPSKRLIDQTPTTCAKCGRQLSDADRGWRQAWCDECRQTSDKVIELDIALRTEPRSYNWYGRDPLDRFPEWPKISTYICNKYIIFMVEPPHWDRFLNEYQTNHGIDRESVLGMRLAELATSLDRRSDPSPSVGTDGRTERTEAAVDLGAPKPEGEPAAPAIRSITSKETPIEPAAAGLTEETPLAITLKILQGSSRAKSLVKFLHGQKGRKATLLEVTRRFYCKGREPTADRQGTAKQQIRRTAQTLAERKAPLRIEYDWDQDEISLVDVAANSGPARPSGKDVADVAE